MKDKVIGIFGGSGFIGLELVSLLCKSGYKIKVFSRNPSSIQNLSLLGDIGQISIISGNVPSTPILSRNPPVTNSQPFSSHSFIISLIGL